MIAKVGVAARHSQFRYAERGRGALVTWTDRASGRSPGMPLISPRWAYDSPGSWRPPEPRPRRKVAQRLTRRGCGWSRPSPRGGVETRPAPGQAQKPGLYSPERPEAVGGLPDCENAPAILGRPCRRTWQRRLDAPCAAHRPWPRRCRLAVEEARPGKARLEWP